jgi:hypothetical protein
MLLPISMEPMKRSRAASSLLTARARASPPFLQGEHPGAGGAGEGGLAGGEEGGQDEAEDHDRDREEGVE